MKHIHTFESFLNEASQGTEVQETVDVKMNSNTSSLAMKWSPEYDMSSLFTLIKSFRKPNINSIVIEIPKIATITADASGITTVPLSPKVKKLIERVESANPGTKFFSSQDGNVWYNATKSEAMLNSRLNLALRLEFMDSIKWPIEVPAMEGNPGNEKWIRERPVFDPTKDNDDLMIWLGELPQLPIKPGVAQATKETVAVVQKVVDLSPKTLTVTVTGVK